MMRRLLILLLALAVVAGAIIVFRILDRPQGIVLTGIVTTHEVNVSPQIQGPLIRLLVKEGDFVKAGELVATIDPQELKADRSFYLHADLRHRARQRIRCGGRSQQSTAEYRRYSSGNDL